MTDASDAAGKDSRDSLGSDYEVDIEQWISRFPYDQYSDVFHKGTAGWCDILGVALLEQFKRQLRRELGPFQEVPTDVFVMAIGEPQRRDVTKVGGLPYRPARLPWPTTSDGQPMTFVAQFRFAESRDHVGPTPSDLLLMFIETYAPYDGECTDQFHFEWHPLGLTDLIRPSDVPPPMFQFVTCYGVRHRTTCITEPRVIEHVERLICQWESDNHRHFDTADYICSAGTIKIGGVPRWNRGYDPPFKPLGRFLCALHAIYRHSDVEFPWINQREPLTDGESLSDAQTMEFGDSSVLNIFLDDAGQVRCTLQFS